MYKGRNNSTVLSHAQPVHRYRVPFSHIGQADSLTVAQGRINSVWRVFTSCLLFPFAPLVFYCPRALCSFGVFPWKILVYFRTACSMEKFPLHTLCFAPLHTPSPTGGYVHEKCTPAPLPQSLARRGRGCPFRAVIISSLIVGLTCGCRLTIVTRDSHFNGILTIPRIPLIESTVKYNSRKPYIWIYYEHFKPLTHEKKTVD
jgi:hypothetical protein